LLPNINYRTYRKTVALAKRRATDTGQHEAVQTLYSTKSINKVRGAVRAALIKAVREIPYNSSDREQPTNDGRRREN